MEKEDRPETMDEDNIMIEKYDQVDDHEINIDDIEKPSQLTQSADFRRVSVPQHRMTPLRNSWETIVKTIVERLKLQIRMNTKKKCVEIRSCAETDDKLNIQRACDFIKAFMLGFNLNDAIAMLRLDDLYLESLEIRDGKLRMTQSSLYMVITCRDVSAVSLESTARPRTLSRTPRELESCWLTLKFTSWVSSA